MLRDIASGLSSLLERKLTPESTRLAGAVPTESGEVGKLGFKKECRDISDKDGLFSGFYNNQTTSA